MENLALNFGFNPSSDWDELWKKSLLCVWLDWENKKIGYDRLQISTGWKVWTKQRKGKEPRVSRITYDFEKKIEYFVTVKVLVCGRIYPNWSPKKSHSFYISLVMNRSLNSFFYFYFPMKIKGCVHFLEMKNKISN